MVGVLLTYTAVDCIQAKGGGSSVLHRALEKPVFPLLSPLIYYSRLTVGPH